MIGWGLLLRSLWRIFMVVFLRVLKYVALLWTRLRVRVKSTYTGGYVEENVGL